MWQRFTRWLSGRAQVERLAAIEEKVGRFGRAQREELAVQRDRLDELMSAVSARATTDSIRAVLRRLEDVQAAFGHQDRVIADALERARVLDEQGVEDRRFARRLEQMTRDDRPIVIGPWTGEVGFELLYWIPFVRWVVDRYGLPPERLTIVTRGGAARWYGMPAAREVDVFTLFSPEEFRVRTSADESRKQRRVGAFDADVVKRALGVLGIERAELLHPGMMYRLFMPFWKGTATSDRVDAYTVQSRLDAGDDPVLETLPADYVAARFYFSDCFPDTAANRAFVAATTDSISRQHPVVLLNTPFSVDDHLDAEAGSARVIRIGDRMSPERNLAVQGAVIARARAFVGTYGGYSYLAPFCGVSSLAFYSAPTFKVHHLHVAQRVVEQIGGGALVPLDVGVVPLLRLAVPTPLVTTP
jgi:hypothetical protein